MISFPRSKINLGLHIISKRADGFHNLETIFYPLPVRDVLEIVPSEDISLVQSGTLIDGIKADNLVLRAYQLLKNNHPSIGPLAVYLHKVIPMGAGLGGGSSDAAEMIKLINDFFRLRIPSDVLAQYALTLGSDCPFFMQPDPCFATGRGEMLESVNLDLSAYSILLVHPEIHISTAWAFSKINITPSSRDLKNKISEPVKNWAGTINNDFEKPVFSEHPSLKIIKETLYTSGALYASMTGSGSTIFGIFPKNALPSVKFEHSSQTRIS